MGRNVLSHGLIILLNCMHGKSSKCGTGRAEGNIQRLNVTSTTDPDENKHTPPRYSLTPLVLLINHSSTQQTHYVISTWRYCENKVDLNFYVKTTWYTHGKPHSSNEALYMLIMFLMLIFFALMIYTVMKCIVVKKGYVTHYVIFTCYSRGENNSSKNVINYCLCHVFNGIPLCDDATSIFIECNEKRFMCHTT